MADVHITPEGLEGSGRSWTSWPPSSGPAIVAKIKAAREFGDLSENFEYHAAKNEQGMMEARIKELEAIIKNHVLIETAAGARAWSAWAAPSASTRTARDEETTASSAG